MADQRMVRLRDRLGTRLGVAFTATALATVAVVTAVALTASSAGIAELADEQRAAVARDVVTALGNAYLDAGGWEDADLLPAHTMAAAAGAVLIVTTAEFGELPTPPGVDAARRRFQEGWPTGDLGSDGDVDDGADPEQPQRRSGDGVDDTGGSGDGADVGDDPGSPDPDDGPADDPADDGTTDGGTSDTGGNEGQVGPDGGDRPTDEGRHQRGGPPPDDESASAALVPAVLPWPSGAQPTAAALSRALPWPSGAQPASLPEAGDLPDTPEDADIQARIDLPIVVGGQTLGTATLLFVGREVSDPTATFRADLLRHVLLGAGLAALLALAVTVFVTARLTRPLRSLVADVERLRRGGRLPPRPDTRDPPGEIGVLHASIGAMADDLRRQEALRRALVADVGHELRTPVTILLGELEALRDGLLTADAEQLASLHEEVQRIARLVEDVDSLADAEAAGFSLERVSLDLADATRAALRGLEPQLAAAGLELRTDLDAVSVDGDRRRLEQVVRNLLTNAARFAPAGSIIEVAVRSDDADEAVLEVTDRGPGFDPAELPHVFDRFWRGQAAAGTGGSGIGLAVVAEVVGAHGGAVSAANRPDGGAVVTVRLPRSSGVPEPADRQPARSTAVPADRGTGLPTGS